jgi:hypothetical protein
MGSKSKLGLAACTLAAALVVAPLVPPAVGAPLTDAAEKLAVVGESPGSAVKSRVSLERAIQLAKEKVPVPADLDTFKTEYSENNGEGRWMLHWSRSKQPGANMDVAVDADSGEVEDVSYYETSTPGAHYSGLPAYSRDQCLKVAREEATRLLPDRYASTVLVERKDQFIPLLRDRDYPVVYDFYFQRTYNGIPVSEQGINVGINAETGKMTQFNSNWDTGIKLPSSQGRISPEQAVKMFQEKSGYELTYFAAQKDDPDMPGELKLAYRPKPPGRFVLNALTGELMDNSIYFYDQDMRFGGGGEMDLMKSSASPLTPSETRAVEENSQFISPDKAQELASRAVDIPEGYTVSGRNLDRSYAVPGSRVWNISYQDADGKNYMRVSVDAVNGELISFSLDEPWDVNKLPEVKVSQEEAGRIAADFIKSLQPARFGQTALRDVQPDVGPWVKMGSPVAGSYSIQYARLINGVVYPENGFRVRVNSTTGQVTYYEMTWWNTAFPAAGNVIGVEAANQKYLSNHPLRLEYGRGYQRWGMDKEPGYYLVYRPEGAAGVMLDAHSGEEIDYRGNPVAQNNNQSFSDISGHPAEQDILLLAGEGIITGDGGKFRPDDAVTGAEALAMLVKAYDRGSYYPLAERKDGNWYEKVMERATAMGILDGDFTVGPDDGLNRLLLARLGVNAAGWGKLAKVHDIFRLDTADSAKVPDQYRGYAAAALGLGLLNTDNGSFAPDRVVTRGEAATFLVKLLKQ